MSVFTEATEGFMALLIENNQKIGSLGTAIDRLSTRVEAVKVPEDLISSHVERVYSVYASAASKSAEQFAGSSAAFVTALQNYSDAAMELSKRLETFSDLDGSTLSEAVSKVLDPLRNVTQDLALAARDTRSVGLELSAAGNRFEENISRLSGVMEAAASSAMPMQSDQMDNLDGQRI